MDHAGPDTEEVKHTLHPDPLTLLGEDRFPVEWPQVQRLQVAQVAVTGVAAAVVQLGLDADGRLTCRHVPVEVLQLCSCSIILTFEET